MHLYYAFDNAEIWGEVDSLLGYVGLRHGDSVIEEHDVFLDSWIAALMQGLTAAEEGRWGPVEIWEETQPLVFEPADEGFRISYGNDSVTIPSTDELRKVLTDTGNTFYEDADGKVAIRENDPLDVIRRFLKLPWYRW
ncbi:MAG TPA: hypothetical protein VN493_09280 [Thermoanaerobaculia bacterium]|nr:hypothetical protein [Thermoanaerobaculia bacterium]